MVNGNLVAAGTKVVIPTNVVAFLAYDSTVTKSDDGTAFTLSRPSKCYFYGDVELNGTMTLPGNDLYARMFYGALTGRGNIELNGFWQYLSVFGSCDFDGTVMFWNSQIGQNLHIYSSSPTSHVGTVSTGDYLQQNDKGEWRDAAQYVYFEPKREDATAEPSVLVISNLNIRMYQDKELATDSGRRRRRGPQLIAYSNNTIRVESITGKECPIGLFAESDCNYMVGNPPAFDKGLGNVILGDHGNRNSYYYVSPMMNVTLAGTHGLYSTCSMGFDYRAESNVVNQAEFLDLSGITSYPNPRSVQIWGYSPANLPRSIRLRYRESQGDGCIPLNLTDSEWTMPFDFGAADANPARCETNCKLVIPSSGTVYVTNATVAADAAYPTEWTEYPVLTTYAGGAPTNDAGESVFNDWEIRLLGDWRKMKVEKVVKDTGLYLRMRKTSGFKIIIR